MTGSSRRTPRSALALALLAALFTQGCAAGGRCTGDGYKDVGCRADRSRERLSFGLTREQALAMIGASTVEPPWRNAFGAGPDSLSNPFDSFTATSELGEEYEVVRFFVRAYGVKGCPFIQGRVLLEPLIFLDGQLVGWRWSYLEDVTGHRVGEDRRTWRFGVFCDQLGRDTS